MFIAGGISKMGKCLGVSLGSLIAAFTFSSILPAQTSPKAAGDEVNEKWNNVPPQIRICWEEVCCGSAA
jgi:hypothetical protein